MPPNKARDNANAPTKPFMPTVASGRNVKSPITPRLATQHLNATPPVARSARSNTPTTVRSPGAKDDLSTPAKVFISHNITPRSSSRKSRVDSNNTTPIVTPNGPRSAPAVDTPGGGFGRIPGSGFGLAILSPGSRSRPTSIVSGGIQGTTLPGLGSQPMFFHANDVQQSPEMLPATSKSPVFLYANGAHEEAARSLSQPSPPLSSVSTRSKTNKFFHADGSADDDVPPVPQLPSPLATTSLPQFFQNAPAFRPPSPNKDNFHLSYRKGASQIIRPDTRPKAISILPSKSVDIPRTRSTSGGIPKAIPHKRTSSLSSIESGASVRKASLETCGVTPLQTVVRCNTTVSSEHSGAPLGIIPPVISEHSVAPETTISLPNLDFSTQTSLSSQALSVPQSPTKGPGGWQPQLSETIMNARVERKIQDLEISNSSLMAINKTLEKEVRRQNKELRRFRRLSRAGRLSGLSMGQSIETIGEDDEFEHTPVDLNILEELSEEEQELSEEEPESSDDSSNGDGANLSVSAIAEREERKLAKDSKRLQLDLAKHRELLVDSQKMNQSLKRCMTWTEMMIKDGRKALDYEPGADLGGRVIDVEHEEDDGLQRHSLLSSWTPSPVPMPALEALDGILGIDTRANPERRSWQSEEGADSGIEVDSYGRGSKVLFDAVTAAEELASAS